MDYSKSKQRLFLEFHRNDFNKAFRNNQFFSLELILKRFPSGAQLIAVYPEKKSNPSQYRFDYRVDIIKDPIRIALSHVNIIVDIYNKCINQSTLNKEMENLLRNIIVDGGKNPYEDSQKLESYHPSIQPDPVLLDRVEKAHGPKIYQRVGNHWDYPIDELISLIKWITLQEDINYPMPVYEGRRMPFARYWEAICCAQEDSHQIEEVVVRALSHQRPKPWSNLDYSFLNLAH